MSEQSIPLQRWTDSATEALADIAASSLGCAADIAGVERPVGDEGLCGSLVTLASDANTTCIGLSASAAGCRRLAGAMLGMDPDEAEELSHDDVRDSIGELVNILAGAVKTRVSAEDPALAIGLPIFFDGGFEGGSRSRGSCIACRIGDTDCVLTLLLGAEARTAAA